MSNLTSCTTFIIAIECNVCGRRIEEIRVDREEHLPQKRCLFLGHELKISRLGAGR